MNYTVTFRLLQVKRNATIKKMGDRIQSVAQFQFTISLLFIDLLFKKEESIEITDV